MPGSPFASFATFALQARAAPIDFELLPEQSFVTFEVLHFDTSTIRGRFGPLQGVVTLDPAAPAGGGANLVSLRINTGQIDTGSGIFNARLRQPDLLDSQQHPEAFFVSRQLRFDGQSLAQVRGEFTFRGVSQPLTLLARRYGCWTQPRRWSPEPVVPTAGDATPARPEDPVDVCGGDFEGEVLRSSFGATFGLPFVADRVRLVVQVAGLKR